VGENEIEKEKEKLRDNRERNGVSKRASEGESKRTRERESKRE